jgi:histidinol-phosphate aminotransferase
MIATAYAGPGDEVLMTEHSFAMYKISTQANGATPVEVPEVKLTADVDALLAAAGPRTRVCFLANPNNPTGTYISSDAVRRLREGLPDHTLLVIDAAYAEYLRRNDYSPGIELVDGHDNVVMTRTFSKIFGLSALRLGWMYAPREVIDVVTRVRGPFNVNAPAQAAGIAALQDTQFLDNAIAFNEHWMPWLENEIAALGLKIHPSSANFVLVEFPDEPGKGAETAYQYLLARGIIPRRLDNYGLPKCLRFSLGLEDENREVVAALKEFLAG